MEVLYMGLFNFKNRFLNELSITDEDGNKKNLDDDADYTEDEEAQEEDQDNTEDGVQDEPEDTTEEDADGNESDYTADAPEDDAEEDTDQEQAPEAEPTADDQETDAEADDGNDTLPDEENDANDENTDNAEGNEEGGEENIEGEEDQATDYTAGAEDAGEDNTDGGADTGGESMGTGSSDSTKDPELAGLEKDIFANVTPGQMELKHKELKQLYINLYNMINPLIDKINNIPKTEQNIPVLTFVVQKTTELKDLINYYLTNTYQTRTYLENVMNYQQYLALLNTINQILDEIPTENE